MSSTTKPPKSVTLVGSTGFPGLESRGSEHVTGQASQVSRPRFPGHTMAKKRMSGKFGYRPGDGHLSVASDVEIEEFIGNKIEMMKITQNVMKRISQLGGFVPDYILTLDTLKVPSVRKFQAVVFMTDVSGFTMLTETYSLKGKGGTDKLTKTLANYMGPLAECILRCDGDIIKFAGDAFLSVWEVRSEEEYPEMLQKVIDCALYCQEKYGSYTTDVQITIRVKVGIGCGICYAAGLGSGSYHHYAVYGPGVAAASEAEHHCVSGDVILNPAAWKYCDPRHFTAVPKEDGYMKINDILHFINPNKRGRPIVAHRLAAQLKQAGGEKQTGTTHDIVRPILESTLSPPCENRLRKYVIPPVLKKLDENIPLEYLNESRMVSICFMHLDYGPLEVDSPNYGEQLADIVQTAFVTILRSCTSLNGCLTKVIMFDKGLTYLVVFGLPGFIQDNQTANALKFALEMEEQLKAMKLVREVSIGVTTGATYCGVIGHPRRHEYTVIGKKVNKAARLMCYYPGKVTCDQDTYYSSKLPSYYFQQQEAKNLKGISNVGNIYQYIGSEGEDPHITQKYEFPMLGRKMELELVRSCLREASDEFDRYLAAHMTFGGAFDKHGAMEYTSSGPWMIVIEGENGIGKSRFLASCVREAETLGWRTFTVTLSLQHASSSLYAVSDLLTQAFHMDGIRSSAEREEHLRKLISDSGDPDLLSGLCNLNELLHLKLPIPAKFAYADAKSRHTFAQHMAIQILKHYYPDDLILFCVEDAHYMQQTSWEYLQHISRIPNLVTLMTLRRNNDGLPKIPDIAYRICYHSPHTKAIQLHGLEPPYILPLACQLLEVRGIPMEVEKLLIAKSQGNPFWVEDVLNDLVATQKLKIVEYTKDSKLPKDAKLSFVNPRYIKREEFDLDGNSMYNLGSGLALPFGSSEKLTSRSLRVRNNPEDRLCLVKSNTIISSKNVSGGLKEMMLDTFDSFNTNDQMIMKCACVLGRQFSRAMMNRLLPTSGRDQQKYIEGFQRLMENRVFRCATAAKGKRGSNGNPGQLAPIECACNITGNVFDFYTGNTQENPSQLQLPRYAYCRYCEFAKDNMAEVVYETLTEDLKKELHLRAAKYLETSAIQCVNCGGFETTYVYGFLLKAPDMAPENEEQAIAIKGKRGRMKPRANQLSASRDASVKTMQTSFRLKRQVSETKSKDGGGGDAQKKTNPKSLATRINGLRRTFESGGGQLAAMELDILRSLIESEKRGQSCSGGCCGQSNLNRASLIESEDGVGGAVSVPSSQSKKKARRSTNSDQMEETGRQESQTSAGGGDNMFGSDDEEDEEIEGYDFRGCECTTIQARVCADLIYHYRRAEKTGKCMLHLLEAAEAMIAVGNTQQALQYVDEAESMMELMFEGKLPAPNPEDSNDVVIIDREFNRQRFFMRALLCFETGALDRAKGLFIQALDLMGVKCPGDDQEKKINFEIMTAKSSLWRYHHAPSCCRITAASKKKGDIQAKTLPLKIRSLSYLQNLYKSENRLDLALLVSLWHVLLVQDIGCSMHDQIPAYCSLIEMGSALGNNNKALFYEKKSLNIIRENLGTDEQVDPLGLLTSANLFQTLSNSRLQRGEINSSVDAGFLVLRISNILHDNSLACHIFPALVSGLMLAMKPTELGEAFPGLWFASQADDNWPATATYFSLVMDMILDVGIPMDSFYHCEQFVTGKDWNDDIELFREFDLRFNFEASLALWYARYSKWDAASKWISLAEEHMPQTMSFLGVKGRLRLLQVYLIRANFHQTKKRYQLFANDCKKYKELIKVLKREVKAVPVMEPRLNHLIGYYCRIRDRKKHENYLTNAERIAKTHGNRLELEFIKHSRIVWATMANPDIKYYWLEHADSDTVDWHSTLELPWANIMYSLPVPAWT